MRRSMLIAGVTLALFATGCGDDADDEAKPPTSAAPATVMSVRGEPLAEPQVITSAGGVLDATLRVASAEVEIGGVTMSARTYNGGFVPPTLHMEPGDHVKIALENELDEGTNVHVHGLHVSPIAPGDDVLKIIPAGESFTYEYDLPADHAPGTYWYHSHAHGISEGQVFGGLSGIIIVGGLTKLLPPELREVREQTFALKDVQVDKEGAIPRANIDSNASTTRLVNGQYQPVVTMRPGETQLWRLANIGADIFYRLSLGGARFHIIGEDGNPVSGIRSPDELVLPPGKRYDVLVQAPDGDLPLSTLPYNQGGDFYPEVGIAQVHLEGEPMAPATIPTTLTTFGDLAGADVAEDRTFTFTENEDNGFFINGKSFDHDVVNTTVKLGTVEEWTLVNSTDEQHPFHIHVNDFQVMSVNGKPYDAQGWQDTVVLDPDGGKVVIRMHFRDFLGRYVYHCHILNHEDNGMMAVLEVTP